MTRIGIALMAVFMTAGAGVPAGAETSCEDWNTGAFFERASAADVSRCIKEGADVNAEWTHVYRYRPLHLAAIDSKSPAVVKALLKAGADVNARDAGGATALHFALRSDSTSPAVVKALLDAGASVDVWLSWAQDGPTAIRNPLHFAVADSESPDVVKALLDAGANARLRDSKGWTPLHLAAKHGKSPAVVDMLLEKGADIDSRLVFLWSRFSQTRVERLAGWTPLHVAAIHSESPAVVKALLKAGADVNARDARGNTALDLAQSRDADLDLASLIAGAGGKPEKDLLDREEWGEDLLAEPAGVSCENLDTEAFFKRAGVPDVVHCLSSVDIMWDDESLLRLAVRSGEARVVEILAKMFSYDVNWSGEDGRTPLHEAAIRRHGASPAIVEILLKEGADARLRDKKGKTPFDYAKGNPTFRGTDGYRELKDASRPPATKR